MWVSLFLQRKRKSCSLILHQFIKTYYSTIYEQNTSFLFKGDKPGNAPSLADVVMELRRWCNQLFFVCISEERILADADSSGPYKLDQDKSSIWYKVLFLMETPLRILIDIQSLKNNLLRPQEIWFLWEIFYKSCRVVSTRPSFESSVFCCWIYLIYVVSQTVQIWKSWCIEFWLTSGRCCWSVLPQLVSKVCHYI